MQSALAIETERYCDSVLLGKYAKGQERTIDEVYRRVARGLSAVEEHAERAAREAQFLDVMRSGFCPAGRIMSAAGTHDSATLINCFVLPLGDSPFSREKGKPGVYLALAEAAETLRRGGGVGYDFSAIRPRGARMQGYGEAACGPVPLLHLFDRSCETMQSAGRRRGAQMGVLRVDHPDIEDFVRAKDVGTSTQGLRDLGMPELEIEGLMRRLRPLSTFNLSVAIGDAFMRLKDRDADLELVHAAEPDASLHPEAYRRDDGQWVYRRVNAAVLWNLILRTSYETSSPGVVFIDRMNAENNLRYCETIEATNPCGEQPLPDYGACCLGSINLASFVRAPFEQGASLDWERLKSIAGPAVRMLDNALDATPWPLPAQQREASDKRRIGLGFTGLGTALTMLRVSYGSDESLSLTADIARTLRDAAYRASVALARERGHFPRFDAQAYLDGAFVRRLPEDLRADIRRHGTRNSHLLSVAPAGSISLAFGRNVSSGIEPAFAWEYTRGSLNAAGEPETHRMLDFAVRRYLELGGKPEALPAYFVSSRTLAPIDHLRIQAAAQAYVDAAISKTVNVALDCRFEDFRRIYDDAYRLDCKGCTTYRRSDAAGGVLCAQDEAHATRAPASV